MNKTKGIEIYIKNLIDELNHYTKLYDEGRPAITDKEWDEKYFELVKLEKEFNIYNSNSPTQSIPFQVINELQKVEHNHPMLSLDKTKEKEDIKTFINNKDYIIMSKMDGLTCSLTYNEKGSLIKAETRGNGTIGEDILHNALQIRNIPKRINTNKQVVIDGEVICTYENFERFKDDYRNPRNFASGSIRLLDSKECARRELSFIAWDCIEGLENCEKLSEKLDYMIKEWTFDVVPFHTESFFNSITFLEDTINTIKEVSEEKSYPIDGVVFKYDKCKEYSEQGTTDHHQKGGLAYKFYDEEYETALLDIEWGMGRTGILTPIAIFEPIEIDGTIVNRASLHNISIMKTLLNGYGWKNQKVFVYKSNMIIPQISRAEEDMDGNEEFKIPNTCPICGGDTVIKKDNDSEMLYCNSPHCQGKLVNRLDHFCGKKGLDIKGLSIATLDKLIKWGYVESYKDIFTLNKYKKEWIQQNGFGEKSVNKILDSIENSRHTTLDKIISASGIPEIGSKVAKDLAKHYSTWEEFRKETDFYHYDGIGEVMEYNLLHFDYDFLSLEETITTFLEVKNENMNTSLENEKIKDKIFCITGKTHIWKNRSELSKDIEDRGGKVVGSISGKVNYLINNDINSTSSKNVAAKAKNITIITEEQYKELF